MIIVQIKYVKYHNYKYNLFLISRIEQNFNNHTITMNGDITIKMALTFLNLDLKNIKTIILNSPGGDVYAAKLISFAIRKLKINTLVERNGRCASSCTWIFQAGTKRTAYKSSLFLYHFVSVYNIGIANGKLDMIYNLYESIIETNNMFVAMEKYGLSSEFKKL